MSPFTPVIVIRINHRWLGGKRWRFKPGTVSQVQVPITISHAIGYAKYGNRSDHAVIFVDPARNVIETHEHTGDFKEW